MNRKDLTVCMLVTNSLKKDPRVQREARAAHEAGLSVIVIGQEDQHFDKVFLKSIPYKVDIIILGKTLLNTTNFFLRAIRMPYRFLSFVFKTASYSPAVIHCNDLNTLLQGWLASKLCGAKVVYDSHEVNTPIGEKALSKKESSDVRRENFLIRKVSKVVSVSNAAAQLIGDYYGIKPLVVTNCSYRVPIDYTKEKDNKYFNVLYHGIISPDRGYEEFVLAGKYISDNVKLIIRGYGPTEAILKNLVAENLLENKVQLVPPVEIKDLIPTASISHVGVVLTKPVNPNYKYTVGNKVFEYINAGLPVILSNVPEHQYLIKKFNFGIIVDEVTPENISTAINELAQNKAKYKFLRENAISTSKIMCWENESKKLIELYIQLSEKK